MKRAHEKVCFCTSKNPSENPFEKPFRRALHALKALARRFVEILLRIAKCPACYRSLSGPSARTQGTGVSREVCLFPKTGLCKGVSHRVSPGVGPRVSKKCPESVPRVSKRCPGQWGHSRTLLDTLEPRARRALETPHFRRHSRGHSPKHSGPDPERLLLGAGRFAILEPLSRTV